MITAELRKIKNKIFADDPFPNDIDGFLEELKGLDNNLPDIERSIVAFRILESYIKESKLIEIIRSLIYGIGYVVLYLICCGKKKPIKEHRQDIIYYKISNNIGILPTSYKINESILENPMGMGLYCDKIARKIMSECFKRNISFYAKFNILFSLCNYGYIVHKYNPKEIITSYESSPACSILTYYCHLNNIKHVNFMHGEKLLSHVNVFGHFDTMYVWDEHYKEMFNKLKYKVGEYIIENNWKNIRLPDNKIVVQYKFYLNHEKESCLVRINEIVETLNQFDIKAVIRPHPSQYGNELIERCIKKQYLENPFEKNICDSLSETENVVARYSTVLFQAYSNNKNVIIDDVSNEEEYINLNKLDYIMFKKKYILLSQILHSLHGQ